MKKILLITAIILLFVSTGHAQRPGTWGGGSVDLTTITTAVNTAYATVASHATTSAIWAAAGNVINFTGNETITALPAAAQAGSQRWLICAGTPTFTHAGALTVQGGATYTAVAGDLILVTATTTTAFKINIFRNMQAVGVSGTPTDEQLACWEITDGSLNIKSCGAKTTDNSTASHALCKDDSGEVENCAFDGATLSGTTAPTLTINSIKITKETGDGTYKGIIFQYTAGETLAFGEPVYVKSDGKVWKADADGAATMPCIGLIVVGGNADATVSILIHGSITETDWNWTVGGLVYVADGTAGVLTQTLADISDTNDIVQVIGVATHADSILVMPSMTMIVLE